MRLTHRLFVVVIGVACGVVDGGCATAIAIQSEPAGLLVQVDEESCRTPCTVDVGAGRGDVPVAVEVDGVKSVAGAARGGVDWVASAGSCVFNTSSLLALGAAVLACTIVVSSSSTAVLAAAPYLAPFVVPCAAACVPAGAASVVAAVASIPCGMWMALLEQPPATITVDVAQKTVRTPHGERPLVPAVVDEPPSNAPPGEAPPTPEDPSSPGEPPSSGPPDAPVSVMRF